MSVSSNGGNPRLDRIEKLIEQSERANKEAHARHEKAHALHEREMRQIKDHLRRWTVLGVKEARNQRKRAREIDKNITRLSAAQLVTEEKLQRFISSLERGRNGQEKKR
jgi:hypothetical protein